MSPEILKRLYGWIDRNILGLDRELRLSYLPPLMVYLAAGVSGLTGIVGTFLIMISLRNFWRCPVLGRADNEDHKTHPAQALGGCTELIAASLTIMLIPINPHSLLYPSPMSMDPGRFWQRCCSRRRSAAVCGYLLSFPAIFVSLSTADQTQPLTSGAVLSGPPRCS